MVSKQCVNQSDTIAAQRGSSIGYSCVPDHNSDSIRFIAQCGKFCNRSCIVRKSETSII